MATEERAPAVVAAEGAAAAAAPQPQPPKREKKKPDNLVIPAPKPKLSKVERRALQEQQRAAKAQGGGGGGGTSTRPQVAATATVSPASSQQERSSSGRGAAVPDKTKDEKQAQSSLQQQQQPFGGDIDPAGDVLPLSSLQLHQLQRHSSISIVSHLTPYRDVQRSHMFATGATLLGSSSTFYHSSSHSLHPAVVKLGWEYATGSVRGGNARCRAMLECFAQVLKDYQIPTTTTATTIDPRQALDQQVLKPSFAFLVSCRPHSVTMGNAFTFLKSAVASLDRDLGYQEMCATLIETMQAYQQERIDLAGQAIAELVLPRSTTTNSNSSSSNSSNYRKSSSSSSYSEQKSLLSEKDVVLVYGHSEVVHLILQHASVSRIIVVDSRPLLEGRKMLDKLLLSHNSKNQNNSNKTPECSYIFLNALTYVLKDVTKVLLGACALMSDGSVLGRAGMASVALLAHAHHIPVLVCAETYKISNRGVQLESITCNELGDPKDLPTTTNNNNSSNNLKRLHLMYDLTPASFVTGIVTELGIVPPTSVAVLLREMNPHDVKQNNQ